MKIKQHVMIRRPDDFLRGNYRSCFGLMDKHLAGLFGPEENYIDCGEITLEIDVDHDVVVATVVNALDAEIKKEQGEHELKMNMLKQRKDELLAITHEVSA